ncbi:MAG: MFS transporter [Lactobacillaceae bacterium]|jgi:predicted MFS family arabinose efflux permease|nr:MFS transporter [Lactobacillaceae bacterium]
MDGVGIRKKFKHVEVSPRYLYVATLFQSTGASLLWPITTLYMHNELHESMTVAGIVLMAMSLLMMLGSWVGGQLFDRWHPFKALVTFILIALATLVGLTFWHSWPTFAVFLLIIGFADGAIYTILNAYTATVSSIDARKVFNLQYLFMNVGVVLGTLLVGFIFDHGVAYIFGVAVIMYIVFLTMVLLRFNVSGMARQAVKAAEKAAHTNFKTPHLIYLLLGLVFSMYVGYILWETVIATHMTALGFSTQEYSMLWTINGVVIIIGQLILNRFVERLPFKFTVLGGSFFFAVSFIFLMFANTYAEFVATFMILTVGELLAMPQIPAWIDRIGNPDAKGQEQGYVTMMTSFGRAVGPLYGGVMIDKGFHTGLFLSVFGAMFLFIVLAGLSSRSRAIRK